tara:strand:+ start:7556 stop:8377 length:822 start_codon:yes stop_codon:yes gene_type:complete
MIKFNCNSCGACCKEENVALTVTESLKLINKFPMVCSMKVLCLPEQAINANANANPHLIRVESNPTYLVSFELITIPSPTGCVNLGADLMCGIYEGRPHACAIYPVAISNKFEKIEARLINERKNNIASNEDRPLGSEQRCEGFDDNVAKDVICENGELKDVSVIQHLEAMAKEDELSLPWVSDFLNEKLPANNALNMREGETKSFYFPLVEFFEHVNSKLEGNPLPVEDIGEIQKYINMEVLGAYELEIIPVTSSPSLRSDFINMLQITAEY